MKESDLYDPVKKLLLHTVGCEKVYAEVLNYDVIGVIGKQNIIVEMKKALNFKVLEQAVEAKRHGHYVFIAVPQKKGGFLRIVKDFLKFHGIGLIVVKGNDQSRYAEIPYGLFAKYNRKTGDIRKYIKDGYHDTIVGGSKMGDYDYQSDYTLMMRDVERFLKRKQGQWVTVDEILEYVECYYSQPKPQLTQTLKANWNNEWCEWRIFDRKTYFRIKNDRHK